jgi:hypothetical protein
MLKSILTPNVKAGLASTPINAVGGFRYRPSC